MSWIDAFACCLPGGTPSALAVILISSSVFPAMGYTVFMVRLIFILFGLALGVIVGKTMAWMLSHPGQTVLVMLLIIAASGIATLLRLMSGR